MSRIRLVVLSLATVLAVSALATASASAEFVGVQCQPHVGGKWKNSQCTEKGPPNEFETEEITNAAVEGEGATAILKSEIGSTKIYIDCQKTKFTGTLEKGNKSTAEIQYTECALYEESTGKPVSACKVEPITAIVEDKLEGVAGAIEDKFTEKSMKPFAEITITGASCALKVTKLAVTGSQKCKLPGAEANKVEHEINCEESGSSLKFGTKAATYRGKVTVKLTSKDPWWVRIV